MAFGGMIMWKDIRWDKGPAGENLVETAHLICPKCGMRHDDSARQKMVMAGKWIATNPRVKDKPGFWANAFLCLLRGKRKYRNRLHQWAAEFLEAKHKGPEVLRTFVNTVFAESYEYRELGPLQPLFNVYVNGDARHVAGINVCIILTPRAIDFRVPVLPGSPTTI